MDRFSSMAQAKNWMEVSKIKMAYNLNHISDDEEAVWLENIDPSLLNESSEKNRQTGNSFIY